VGYDFDLVSIGSGPAGQRAAVQAAKLGKRAAVIEKRRSVGGVCVATGTIPSKTLREAVLAFGGSGGLSSRFRWARPTLRPSATQLFDGVEAVIAREVDVIDDQLRRNDVTLIPGEASFLDPHTLAVSAGPDVRKVSAEYIVIAVGTQPASPPGVQPDGEVILNSDQIVHMRSLPHSLAVVGAGIIGTEYASMFAVLGVEVTLVERRDRPLEFVDEEIFEELFHQLRKLRMTTRFGETVARLSRAEGEGARRAVLELESGKRITADAVLFSAGRQAATDSLRLEAAQLRADDRGRVGVRPDYRTAVPHIFAAGDVIGYPSLAATSSEQGRLAACNAFGLDGGPMRSHYPIGIYSIPEISMVGATEQELTRHKVPYEMGVARYGEIARGQILGDHSGMFKMLFRRETRELLGVHCIGSDATELVHIGQAVLALGGGLDYFVESVFNYPTFAECYKVAALNAANKLRE
jgi:NAD(P) transhydrogenase